MQEPKHRSHMCFKRYEQLITWQYRILQNTISQIPRTKTWQTRNNEEQNHQKQKKNMLITWILCCSWHLLCCIQRNKRKYGIDEEVVGLGAVLEWKSRGWNQLEDILLLLCILL